MGIGVGADEMRAAVGQRAPGRGEAEVVLGQRLVEVGPEAERRAIGIRERSQPDPDAAGRGHGLAQPVDQAAADRCLGHAATTRSVSYAEPDGPRGARDPVADQGGERVARLALPQASTSIATCSGRQQADERRSRRRPAVEQDEPAAAERRAGGHR